MSSDVIDLNTKKKRGYRQFSDERKEEIVAYARINGIKPAGRFFEVAPHVIRSWMRPRQSTPSEAEVADESIAPADLASIERRLNHASLCISTIQHNIYKLSADPNKIKANATSINHLTAALEKQLKIEGEFASQKAKLIEREESLKSERVEENVDDIRVSELAQELLNEAVKNEQRVSHA